MPLFRSGIILAICSILLCSACTQVNLYEKSVAVPGHAWKNDFTPAFSFTIKDSAAHHVYLVLRHDEKYNFNNLIINLDIRYGTDSADHQSYDLPLTAGDKGWTGTGMDDIYEHRIALHVPGQPESGNEWYFRPGNYTFTVKQNMREDPLQHVYNVGVRVEKAGNK